jgi:hypothetical protein
VAGRIGNPRNALPVFRASAILQKSSGGTFMLLRVLAVLAIGGLFGGADAVRAQEPEPMPGRTYASSFGPIPANLPVTVKPWDNSAGNMRVKASFTDALSKRGVKLAESGTPLLLNFETEVESLAGPSVGPTLGQVQGRNWDSRVRMNLWSNQQDSALGGRRTGEPTGARTVRYNLRATLDDQRTGQRLWQAEASYTGAPADESTAFAAMVPVLVEGFGQNVRAKGFRIE